MGHANLLGIVEPAPVKAGHHEGGADQHMRRCEIFNVKKVEALAEDLRLMLPLDAQALTRVHSPEAFLEPVADFVRPRREGGCTPRLHGHEGSPFGISAPVMLKHRVSIACQIFVKYGTHCRS